jgi:hypothetical protein
MILKKSVRFKGLQILQTVKYCQEADGTRNRESHCAGEGKQQYAVVKLWLNLFGKGNIIQLKYYNKLL